MKKIIALALILLGSGAAACSAQMPSGIPPTAAPLITLPHRSGTLRFSLNGPADVLDVPRLMALDSLKEQGYTIEQTVFADQTLIPVALVRGDIDFASTDTNVTWTAITKGIDVRTVVGRTITTTYLIGKQNLQICRDLNGKPIALGSATGLAVVMFDKYLQQNCPALAPNRVIISGSTNRVAGLQAGDLDAARLEIGDWLQLDRQSPGKFSILLDFGKEFPLIQFSSFSVRRTWSEQNPEIVKDFIRALLEAHRRIIGNPQLLSDQIVKYLSLGPADAKAAADAYLKLSVWDANGGLTNESIQYMLDFLTNSNSLQAGVKANDVTDLSYLKAVLDEIGRK